MLIILTALTNNAWIEQSPTAAKRSKKGETGDEDVDIGDEMPSLHYPSVEIEKDTGNASSSSSSGSDSSSSSSGMHTNLVFF